MAKDLTAHEAQNLISQRDDALARLAIVERELAATRDHCDALGGSALAEQLRKDKLRSEALAAIRTAQKVLEDLGD